MDKREKIEKIKLYYIKKTDGLINYEKFIEPKWFNENYSLQSVYVDIEEKVAYIKSKIIIIHDLCSQFNIDDKIKIKLIDEYCDTLDFNAIIKKIFEMVKTKK